MQIGRTNCWEFMKCGRDGDGNETLGINVCPACPKKGRVCWIVAGTFCFGEVQGTAAQKLGDCRKCDFYKKVKAWEI